MCKRKVFTNMNSNKYYGRGTVCNCMSMSIDLKEHLDLLQYSVAIKDDRAIDTMARRVREDLNSIANRCGLNMNGFTKTILDITNATDKNDFTEGFHKANKLVYDIRQVLYKC